MKVHHNAIKRLKSYLSVYSFFFFFFVFLALFQPLDTHNEEYLVIRSSHHILPLHSQLTATTIAATAAISTPDWYLLPSLMVTGTLVGAGSGVG